jgi:acetyl-CoA C-acetyltransferase
MREVVICEPVRTPIGRYGGALKALSAAELGEIAVRGLLERTGLDPTAVDDVVLGHCYPSSEAPAIGRVVALNAGLPVTVPGMQVDRRPVRTGDDVHRRRPGPGGDLRASRLSTGVA